MCGSFEPLILVLRIRLQEKRWWPGHKLGELLHQTALKWR